MMANTIAKKGAATIANSTAAAPSCSRTMRRAVTEPNIRFVPALILERMLAIMIRTSKRSSCFIGCERFSCVVGFITATAIAATVTDPTHFKSSRQFAAWLGLTPKQNSSGGKERLGGISKMGDKYLRTLLVVGATSVMRYARDKGAVSAVWINKLLAKKPARLVSVALANKTARIAWVLLVKQEDYRAPTMSAAAR